MKKLYFWVLITMSLALVGCGPDPDEVKPSTKTNTKTNSVEKPKIEVSIATTTTTDFDVVFKVTSKEMPTVTLHYGTTSSCSKSSTCQLYRDGYETRFFKASHTGFAKGTKIYFYGEATNSGGSAKTVVDSRITKR